MKVWEIKEEYRKIEEALENSGGELSPELEAMFDALNDAKEQKIENIVYLIKNNEALFDAIKAEKDKLTAKQKTAENTIERLKTLLSYLVPQGNEVKTATYKVSWGKCPDKVSDDIDMDKLPDVYKRIKEEPDKKMILEALKQNATIEGVSLVTDNYSLRIK